MSSYDMSERLSTGGPSGMIDGNFASMHFRNINKISDTTSKDGTREVAIDFAFPETIVTTFIANGVADENW